MTATLSGDTVNQLQLMLASGTLPRKKWMGDEEPHLLDMIQSGEHMGQFGRSRGVSLVSHGSFGDFLGIQDGRGTQTGRPASMHATCDEFRFCGLL